MKARTRAARREGRKEPRLAAAPKDSYEAGAKLADPLKCPRCGAAYLKGRWTWARAPAGAGEVTCPACRRIEDNFPAGYVTLKGPFFEQHREEVLALVADREQRARAEHPLQRIIGVEPMSRGVRVTTTDIHLAHGIARTVHDAFKGGTLEIRFSKDEHLVRATWTR